MSSTVYFTDMRARDNTSLLAKLEGLCDRVGLAGAVAEGEPVAIKVHFGERGCTAFVRPIFVRRIVDKVKAAGGVVFLTDTNTLYVGNRSDAVRHLETAVGNGFAYSVVGAPLIIADGLTGKDYVEVDIRGKHFEKVRIAGAAFHAGSLVAVTHVKGHGVTGLGGALKNIGMGLGCRSAKQAMHSSMQPQVDEDVCTACGRCLDWCPAEAITLESAAVIDQDKCEGCGECTVTCLEGAIAVRWEGQKHEVQERIAEYAAGVLAGKRGRAAFFNFLMQIGPECDCWGWSDAAIVPDIGILASTDPVAIDQASADLINAAPALAGSRIAGTQESDKIAAATGADWGHQIAHAESLGLGSREYELVEL